MMKRLCLMFMILKMIMCTLFLYFLFRIFLRTIKISSEAVYMVLDIFFYLSKGI